MVWSLQHAVPELQSFNPSNRIGTLVASATHRWKNIKCLSMCVVGRCSSSRALQPFSPFNPSTLPFIKPSTLPAFKPSTREHFNTPSTHPQPSTPSTLNTLNPQPPQPSTPSKPSTSTPNPTPSTLNTVNTLNTFNLHPQPPQLSTTLRPLSSSTLQPFNSSTLR